MNNVKLKLTSVRLPIQLYKLVCQADPTGRGMFSTGLVWVLNKYFKRS